VHVNAKTGRVYIAIYPKGVVMLIVIVVSQAVLIVEKLILLSILGIYIFLRYAQM
jgi:hypothetical protein